MGSLKMFSKFFIHIFIKSIYVLTLTYFWDEHLVLWATENFNNSIFGGCCGQSGEKSNEFSGLFQE